MSISMFKPRVAMPTLPDVFKKPKPGDVDLQVGQPDFGPPEHVLEAMRKALEKHVFGYCPVPGLPELREAIANSYNEEYGLNLDKENVLITCGASEALNSILETFVGELDSVLLTDPCFLAYPSLVAKHGATPIYVQLDKKYCLDLLRLEERFEREKPDYLLINYPNNPTGAIITKKDLEKIVELCRDYNVGIISDEVYEKFYYEGKHTTIFEVADLSQAMVINSFSKTLGMCESRIGYVVGDKKLLEPVKVCHQTTITCAPRIAQLAVLEAYKRRDETEKFLREKIVDYNNRRNLVCGELRKLGFDLVEPGEAFYVFPSVKKLGFSAELLVSKLGEEGVLVLPGKAFGPTSGDKIRISFSRPSGELRLALERLATCLEKLG